MSIFDLTKTLNNGVKIPILGLGVFKSGGDTKKAVECAINAGYRHIDTAAVYGNEDQVAEGIRLTGINRDELFITTKLWNDDMRNGMQVQAIERSLELLKTDYIDLYLIHWPVAGKFAESWAVMEEYHKKGVLRAIGVSNFTEHHIDELMVTAKITPAVNQVECSPLFTQEGMMKYCNKMGIAMEAWSPLAKGAALTIDDIKEIADKYKKTSAQIIIRWHIQNDRIVIPKSVHEDRIISNSKVADFELTKEDMNRISALNENKRMGSDPNNFNF